MMAETGLHEDGDEPVPYTTTFPRLFRFERHTPRRDPGYPHCGEGLCP
jgi:hypothetical protein